MTYTQPPLYKTIYGKQENYRVERSSGGLEYGENLLNVLEIEQHWPRSDRKRSHAGKTKAIKVATNSILHEVTNNLKTLLMPVKLAKILLYGMQKHWNE